MASSYIWKKILTSYVNILGWGCEESLNPNMYQQIMIDYHYLSQNYSMVKLSYGLDGLIGLDLSSKMRNGFIGLQGF